MSGAAGRLGIDLGGTKIEAVVLDGRGAQRHRARIATPAGGYDAIIAAIAGLVADCESRVGMRCTVGVGTPGAPSRVTGLMRNCNSTVLNGRPLQVDLGAALGREVRIANDANCFASSEAIDGAAAGLPVVFGVILGTGVGGAIALDGRPFEGLNAIAGEWGHIPLPTRAQLAGDTCPTTVASDPQTLAAFAPPAPDETPGPLCYCGRQGCVETWLAGPSLARDHAAVAGLRIDPREVIAAMRGGDPVAGASFARYVDRLARSLAVVINIVDPDAIVLGGGLSGIDELYDAVPRRWGRYVFSDQVRTPLLRNRHGDASGVRGAAWLWGR